MIFINYFKALAAKIQLFLCRMIFKAFLNPFYGSFLATASCDLFYSSFILFMAFRLFPSPYVVIIKEFMINVNLLILVYTSQHIIIADYLYFKQNKFCIFVIRVVSRIYFL
jgi:hypothetical protein